MSNKKLHPDLLLAQTYLDTLEAEGEFTFQTFPDDNRSRASHLTRVLHGKLKHHAKQLSKLNQQGAGIFVTVNKTDLLGRSKNNVTGGMQGTLGGMALVYMYTATDQGFGVWG